MKRIENLKQRLLQFDDEEQIDLLVQDLPYESQVALLEHAYKKWIEHYEQNPQTTYWCGPIEEKERGIRFDALFEYDKRCERWVATTVEIKRNLRDERTDT